MITLDAMRRFAVARSLFASTTLKRALDRFGFVQADPIRAPARAQDLTLRHRVKDYRAGDLERRYSKLGVAEDFFINYGFVTHAIQALMHPRIHAARKAAKHFDDPWRGTRWPAGERKRAQLLLEFIRETRHGASARGRRALRARQRRTIGAVHRTPPLICSTRCITAACCEWSAAMGASEFMRPISMVRDPRMRSLGARTSMRWWMWPSTSTLRCPARRSPTLCIGCGSQCRSGATS